MVYRSLFFNTQLLSSVRREDKKNFAPTELIRKMFRAMLINENISESLSSQEIQKYLYELAEKL